MTIKKRLQQLAGIKEMKVSTPNASFSPEMEEFLIGLYDQNADEDEDAGKVILSASEYTSDDYDIEDVNMFKSAYELLKKVGKITIDGEPQLTFSADKNGDIKCIFQH